MAKKKAAKASAAGGRLPESTDIKKRPVPVQGDNLPTYYVNNVSIDVTSWDVRMKLGQIHGVQDGVLTVKEIAVVFMSHGHTKAFLEALRSTIGKLESVIPPTPQPDDKTH